MNLRRLLTRRKTMIGVFAGFLGVFIAGSISRDYEILHALDARGLPCAMKDGKFENRVCGVFVRVSIGNTGAKTQPEVRIAWPIDYLRWGINENTLDLVATNRVTPPPALEWRRIDDGSLHVIRGFAPNQVVDYTGICVECDGPELRDLLAKGITVEAEGVVEKGDPRSSTFYRGMRNVARVVLMGR